MQQGGGERRESSHADPAYFDLDVPLLGICYGLQEIAYRSSADNVVVGVTREYGYADLKATIVDQEILRIRKLVGDGRVLGTVSGDVDSTVAATYGRLEIASMPSSSIMALCA